MSKNMIIPEIKGDDLWGDNNIKMTVLTKREYFAGLAMQGYLASKGKLGGSKPWYIEISERSRLLADALIEELEKNDR